MVHHVYILRSAPRPMEMYVGYSTNPTKRLGGHNGGGSKGAIATRKHRPWRIIAIAPGFSTLNGAYRLEHCLQHRKGFRKVDKCLALLGPLPLGRWTQPSTPTPETLPNLVITWSQTDRKALAAYEQLRASPIMINTLTVVRITGFAQLSRIFNFYLAGLLHRP